MDTRKATELSIAQPPRGGEEAFFSCKFLKQRFGQAKPVFIDVQPAWCQKWSWSHYGHGGQITTFGELRGIFYRFHDTTNFVCSTRYINTVVSGGR